jgi:hypothetical protein
MCKKAEKKNPAKGNPVAKNLFTGLNRSVTMRDRKSDYKRNPKHKKGAI